MATEFGILSVVPPLLAIALAIVTRRAMLSLFLGVWSGGIIFAGNVGIAQVFVWITESIGNSTFNAKIIVFTMMLGAGIALVWRLGGAIALTEWATKRVDSHRKVGVTTWLLGLIWNFDDYANNAIVGSSMRTLADELKMSREKLAYVLDSTAAPVATIGLSSWVAFEIGLIANQYSELGIADQVPSAAATFVQSIPFNMYSLLVIAMVGIIVYTQRDFGEMLDAENRAARTGNVIREDARPLQNISDELGEPLTDDAPLRMFFAPVAVLVVTVVGSAIWMGYAPDRTFVEMVNNTGVVDALMWGSFAMVLTAIALGMIEGIITLDQSMDTLLDGFKTMLPAISILVLAWSIGAVATALGTGTYVTQLATGVVSPTMVPVVIFLTSAFISFAIGTSWGTMSIMTPVVVPMAWTIGAGGSLLPVAVGAMFSGAIFGDNCSPISDTTVLASTFAGSDHIDHVRTQMYYAFTVLVATAALYLVYGVTNVTPLVLLPVGVVLLIGLVYVFSELDAQRKDIDARPSAGARVSTGPTSDD